MSDLAITTSTAKSQPKWKGWPRESKLQLLERLRSIPSFSESEPGTALPPFPAWLERVSPQWDFSLPHLRLVQERLADVTAGRILRLAIFCPPRHGKSEQTTIRYPVWRLETRRQTRVCVGCYNQRFAERFGRRSRRLAETRGIVGRDRKAAAEWETPAGGVYRSCGVGSPPMGEGFDLIVIDDPIKSREEAESEAYRERAWEWYQDLYTRREPGAAIVLIQTRWHEADLAGRLLAEQPGEWQVVSLPALAEPGDALGRAEGAPLWPARYDGAELASTRAVLGEYAFQALYQQRPTAREGALFKVMQLQFEGTAPGGSEALTRVRAWDLAATDGDGDYTAGVLIGKDGSDRYYVLDVQRGQWGPEERNRRLRMTAALDGESVSIHLAQDPGQAGKEQIRQLIGMLGGFTVTGTRVTGDKVTRADPFASQVNAGNVTLLPGDWRRSFVEELRGFPMGRNDDQVDAASDAFSAVVAAAEWAFY